VSDKWFDEVDDYFEDGYASVEFNDKYNFINTEGKLVSDKWFSSFSEANSYLKNYK
jgi:hypothetical protein